MSNKTRLQFDFTQEAVDHLEELRSRMDAASKAEVVRRALRLLDYAVTSSSRGGELVLRDENGKESILRLV